MLVSKRHMQQALKHRKTGTACVIANIEFPLRAPTGAYGMRPYANTHDSLLDVAVQPRAPVLRPRLLHAAAYRVGRQHEGQLGRVVTRGVLRCA